MREPTQQRFCVNENVLQCREFILSKRAVGNGNADERNGIQPLSKLAPLRRKNFSAPLARQNREKVVLREGGFSRARNIPLCPITGAEAGATRMVKMVGENVFQHFRHR